jgi:hypothetical protein
METLRPSLGARIARTLKNLLFFALFIGMAGAAVYALSLVNARTYSLEVRAGQLVVLKGRLLPTGAEPWSPSDAVLADTYAPIDLEGNAAPAIVGNRFEERDELDRALFSVLEVLARPKVSSDVSSDLEKGLAYVRRAGRLTGATEEQRASLKKMQTELACFLAKTRLDESRRQLEDALAQLKVAAESDSRHRVEAGLMLLAVEPQVKLLAATLRATTLPADGSSLSRALEPRMKEMFEALQKAVAPPAEGDAGTEP